MRPKSVCGYLLFVGTIVAMLVTCCAVSFQTDPDSVLEVDWEGINLTEDADFENSPNAIPQDDLTASLQWLQLGRVCSLPSLAVTALAGAMVGLGSDLLYYLSQQNNSGEPLSTEDTIPVFLHEELDPK